MIARSLGREQIVEMTAIVGGSLVDGTGKAPIPDSVVLVGGERILNVFRRGEVEVPENVQVIDASGKTIIPGLFDCHSHIGVMADQHFMQCGSPEMSDLFMRESIKHGVTTVRDTGNFDPGATMKLLKEGRPEWPRWFGAGGIVIDGPAPETPWHWIQSQYDINWAREVVRRDIEAGADFIKCYIWMTADLLKAVVEEAHQLGVKVTAHVGHSLTAEDAVKIGVDSLEHVRIGPELVDERDLDELKSLPPRPLDPVASWRPWRFVDPASKKADNLIDLMAEKGVFITPTLTWSQSILLSDLPEVANPPGMDAMPESLRNEWKEWVYTVEYTEHDFAEAKVEMERQKEFIGRAHAGGVKVTAGTDTANPSVIPGAALHDELRLLVECGLTPMDAIVAATSRAAELLDQQAHLGTVERHKLADIVILDDDPLKDIANSRKVAMVMKAGKTVRGPAKT